MADEFITGELAEKHRVTLISVYAAIFLSTTKLTVGWLTGSLGILSEALHSGLDLVAALMTFFAVRIADKPPDAHHPFGHGKIENMSALGETFLLLITCVWIIYEAASRLSSGRVHIEITFWSFAVIAGSIVIDIWRSRKLMHVAKKYNNQAIEADALHFSTDILSSSVVLVGLAGAYLGFYSADAIAALAVALIVIQVSWRLGKRSVDDLIDRTPNIEVNKIIDLSRGIPQIQKVHDIKIRTSGSRIQIELNIHVDDNLPVLEAHEIAHEFEKLIMSSIERSAVFVHIEPSTVD